MMQARGLRTILAAGFAIACGAVANAGGGTNGVTLVSYTATTVTIRTRKALTLNRSDLTAEQLELWK